MRHVLRRPPISMAELGRRTLHELIDDDVLGMSAQLGYYMALALFPALVVLVAIVSYLPWSVLGDLVRTIDRIAPAEIVTLVRDQLEQISRSPDHGLLTVGVLGAIWTSSTALVSIVSTLNRAYDVTESRPWWKVRLLAIALTVGMAVLIVSAGVLVIAGPAITAALESRVGLSGASAWMILQWPLIFALASLGIAIIYYFAPDVKQEWVWITPGSLVATSLWLVVSLGFRYYVSAFGNYNETYGALGAAAILLLWMYLTGLAILIGGEINSVIEHALPEGKAPGEREAGTQDRARVAESHDEHRPKGQPRAPHPSRTV